MWGNGTLQCGGIEHSQKSVGEWNTSVWGNGTLSDFVILWGNRRRPYAQTADTNKYIHLDLPTFVDFFVSYSCMLYILYFMYMYLQDYSESLCSPNFRRMFLIASPPRSSPASSSSTCSPGCSAGRCSRAEPREAWPAPKKI